LDGFATGGHPGDILEIDLTAVKAMTISFADEFLGRFIASRTGTDRDDLGIIVHGPDGAAGEDLKETLDAVLSRRGVGVLVITGRGPLGVVGGPAWFAKTFEEADRLRTFRVVQLADRLSLSPQAANGRLKRLAASGAVLRERVVPDGGGREFEYRVATLPT
jgi:hypothetical protein